MEVDISDDIAELEKEIERLAVRRERCRKLSYAAKIAILAGFTLLASVLTGLVAFMPSLLVGSLAAIIGGIVLLGSNARTWEETEAASREVGGQRAAVIGTLDLRVVDAGVRWLQ